MTIKDAAEKYGVSKQAIYQRLKKQGIALETIKDPETGELTRDAEAVLFKLYGADDKPKTQNLNSIIQSLKNDNKSLILEVEELKKENQRLSKRIEELAEDKTLLAETLKEAQRIQLAMIQQRLPEPRTLWERITGRKKNADRQE